MPHIVADPAIMIPISGALAILGGILLSRKVFAGAFTVTLLSMSGATIAAGHEVGLLMIGATLTTLLFSILTNWLITPKPRR